MDFGGPDDNPRGQEPRLSLEEIRRYSRHLIMPEVALAGQLRLKAARVLIAGAGGLGAPVGLYLAAAGVGKIGLADCDRVDVSNLQRQVIFATGDVGRSKPQAARERLSGLNPGVDVAVHEHRLSAGNALDVIRSYDVVVDCTDNFAARYLISDACVLLGKPNVHGAVFRFHGQATVFSARKGPCYRCLYPVAPAPGEVPDCADAGVLGVIPGVIGSIQAAETVKLIIDKGRTLSGRLLLFDGLEMTFREVSLEKNSDCPACGPNPTITELREHEETCARPAREAAVPEISAVELKRNIDAGEDIVLLDVREPHEFEIANLGGVLIPVRDVEARAGELDRERATVVLCRNGVRSAQVVAFLQRAGFEKVWNLRGGIKAWSDDVDPSVPKY